jgi:hypothetical protein
MVALAAGADRWRQVDLPAFEAQASLTRGFWMSYHELTGGYPWLTKRVARVLHPETALPARNGFAYVLALFSPYVGRGGGALGIFVLAAVIAVVAAVGIPAYRDYEVRSRLDARVREQRAGAPGARRLVRRAQGAARLARSGRRAATLPDGSQLSLEAESMVLTVESPRGALVFAPEERADGTGDVALLGRRRRAPRAAARALPRRRSSRSSRRTPRARARK